MAPEALTAPVKDIGPKADPNLEDAADNAGGGDRQDDNSARVGPATAKSQVQFGSFILYPEVGKLDEPPPSMPPSNAHELSSQDWLNIIEINQLLHGYQIREEVPDVVRARLAAFVLKQPDAAQAYEDVPKVELKPRFHVFDGSNIKVHETKNAFQRSLAQNAFSKTIIEAELSAGDTTAQLGVSAAHEHEKKEGEEQQSWSQGQEYYASYNFPRARVFLDEYELSLSQDCENTLCRIEEDQTKELLDEFEVKFGHVFVISVLLGGQQRTVKLAGAKSAKDAATKEDAVRSALGAKIAAPYVSASVKHSTQQGSAASQSVEQYSDLSYLGMSASGGDTLIGSDIPQWSRTVAEPKNWRVIENEIAVSLRSLIAKFPEKGHIAGLFRWIRSGRPQLNDETKKVGYDAVFLEWFNSKTQLT